MPDGILSPPDSAHVAAEQYEKRRELGRLMGANGWLWATAPTEYGGGGLSLDHSVVIDEEVDAVIEAK